MDGRAGNQADQEQKVTRRDILKTGVVSGLGLSTATLTAMGRPTLSAAGVIYGGMLWCYASPETWDPHLAALLGRWLPSAPCTTK